MSPAACVSEEKLYSYLATYTAQEVEKGPAVGSISTPPELPSGNDRDGEDEMLRMILVYCTTSCGVHCPAAVELCQTAQDQTRPKGESQGRTCPGARSTSFDHFGMPPVREKSGESCATLHAPNGWSLLPDESAMGIPCGWPAGKNMEL